MPLSPYRSGRGSAGRFRGRGAWAWTSVLLRTHEGERETFRVPRGLGRPLQLCHEFLDVAELAIDGRKSYVSHLVQAMELGHGHLADRPPGNFFQSVALDGLFDPRDDLLDLLRR